MKAMPTVTDLSATHSYDLVEAGSGAHLGRDETLVFVHGWLLSRSYWQPLVEQLAHDYRCLTYDLRGFGESVGALDDYSDDLAAYSLAAYAKDLERLLDSLGLDQVWLVGHSLGGSIALWAASLFPHRIKGVICINAGGGIYIDKAFDKFRTAGQQMVKFRPSWLNRVPLLPQVFSRMMVARPLEIRWGRQRIQDFVRANRSAAKGALLASTTEDEVNQLPLLMSELTQPVHFITASQDKVMPPRFVRYLASFHPRFVEGESVTELADCGHMAMVEQTAAVESVVRFTIEQNRD